AGSMRRRGTSERAILAALSVENESRCQPPLSRREVEAIAHSIAQYDPHPARPGDEDPDREIPLTDVGNSMRLAKLLKGSFRYVDSAIYFYDSSRWREDSDLEHIKIDG